MSHGEKKTNRWQLRLWHFFALIAVFALSVWMAQHVFVAVAFGERRGQFGFAMEVRWDDTQLIDVSSYDLE